MITEKIYMMVSVANYELNDDDREKTASFFLVHNKLQRFNYVVLTAQVRLMAQHTDMRCHFSHYQFVRTFLILPSIECHKSPTSMYKKNYLTVHYLEYLLTYPEKYLNIK